LPRGGPIADFPVLIFASFSNQLSCAAGISQLSSAMEHGVP